MVVSRKSVVIIAGPPPAKMLHKGFLQLDYDSHLILYSEWRWPSAYQAWAYLDKARAGAAWLRKAFNRALREVAIPLIKQVKPSFYVIYKGQWLDDDNAEALRKLGYPLAFWSNDSLDRYPSQRPVAELADMRFFIDGGDVQGERDVWLPVAYDPDTWIGSVLKKYDLSFIGRIDAPGYRLRRRYLRVLSRSELPKRYNCIAVCSVGRRWKQWLFDARLALPNLGVLPYRQYCELVAASGAVVNIHQEDGVKPINPMFFAIPGLGSCQVAEDRAYLSQWLEPGLEYIAVNEANFLAELERVLRDEELRRRVAEAGMRRVSSAHTFRHRAETMIEHMAKL